MLHNASVRRTPTSQILGHYHCNPTGSCDEQKPILGGAPSQRFSFYVSNSVTDHICLEGLALTIISLATSTFAIKYLLHNHLLSTT